MSPSQTLSAAYLPVMLALVVCLSLSLCPLVLSQSSSPGLPLVVNTWGGAFLTGTNAAYDVITRPGASALDAVEAGGAACEANRCEGTVGYGGSPDERCETTLDAMIMDGASMKSGAVAALRRIKDAISVARRVLEYTTHTMLAGELATEFAIENGFKPENLSTPETLRGCQDWRDNGHCQPNYRINVSPDPRSSCGPYTPLPLNYTATTAAAALSSPSSAMLEPVNVNVHSHDTISVIALTASGLMAAGTTTNGLGRKLPGRVGDGPITGSGSYVDSDVGACGATGDGDIMMRFLPCYQAVENMRRGMTPTDAAVDAAKRMMRKYPSVNSGLVVVNKTGGIGAAGTGWTFSYAYRGGSMDKPISVSVPPIKLADL